VVAQLERSADGAQELMMGTLSAAGSGAGATLHAIKGWMPALVGHYSVAI
jgi:hypothetical protein